MWLSACNNTGCLCTSWPFRIERHLSKRARTHFVQASLQGSKLLQEAEAWPEIPFNDAVYGKTEAVRVRQHVNPLKKELQVPLPPQDWAAIFPDTARPLIVDVGCGSGRFLMALSRKFQHHNLLGLDIRSKLMDRANDWTKILELQHSVHFMMANATVSLESMLATYPGPLSLVTVQFPDPHFKTRHKKRRVVQPQLVRAIARMMPRGGRVFLQSDVEEAVTDMHHMFRLHGRAEFEVDLSGCPISEETLLNGLDRSFSASAPSADISTFGSAAFNETSSEAAAAQTSSSADADADAESEAGMLESSHLDPAAAQHAEEDGSEAAISGTSAARTEWEPDEDAGCEPALMHEPIKWLDANPLGVPTEREVHTLQDGGRVYRSLFIRI
ncbi:probable tRNA (guanine-N(7)-)-methyltransferase at N-terminal half [Coccomyxa sp. Obi]|nr:probable tRNA (guanine-N(7)-)-methyltransferase at N-terminal half [Coccomyxa sp. Obi]